jgi:DNA repair protein RecO (recombination protein O)
VAASSKYTTPAISIRVIPFGETSQVVQLATPDHGLVAAMAKGAHRPGPEFQGGIPLCTAGIAHLLVRPRAELELLRRFEGTEDLRGLRADLSRFYAASYVLELLRSWMRPALPNPPLFRAAWTSLRALARAPRERVSAWTAWFEARALAATGHRPRLDACAVCGGSLDGRVLFSAPAGGLCHTACAPPGPRLALAVGAVPGVERLYTARLRELAADPPDDAAIATTRAIHDAFVPYVLEKRPAALGAFAGHRVTGP